MSISFDELKQNLANVEGILNSKDIEGSFIKSFLIDFVSKELIQSTAAGEKPGVGMMAILLPNEGELQTLTAEQKKSFLQQIQANQLIDIKRKEGVEGFKIGVIDRISGNFQQAVESYLDAKISEAKEKIPQHQVAELEEYVQAVDSFVATLPVQAAMWISEQAQSDPLLQSIVEAEASIEWKYVEMISPELDAQKNEIIEQREQELTRLKSEFDSGKEAIELEQIRRNPRSPHDGIIGASTRFNPLDMLRARRSPTSQDAANVSTVTEPGQVPDVANTSIATEAGHLPSVSDRRFNTTVPGQAPSHEQRSFTPVATERHTAAFLDSLKRPGSASSASSWSTRSDSDGRSSPSSPATPLKSGVKLPPINVSPEPRKQPEQPDASDGGTKRSPGGR